MTCGREAAFGRGPRGTAASLPLKQLTIALGSLLLLAGCATQPGRYGSLGARVDPLLGVSASPRVIADGDPVPRGGGAYLVGHPYVIAGRSYVPNASPAGYTVVGTASWYGDAFHGRRTANGEIFDKGSITAAHPTLPLPSYVRVTNLGNGRSIIVRVNDRGPYHGGRVMDVSQRVAESLDFRNAGTARIRVDYIGKASLQGSDDAKLAATLRTDGQMAQLGGFGAQFEVAEARPVPAVPPDGPIPPTPPRVARSVVVAPSGSPEEVLVPAPEPIGRRVRTPIPPPRPFSLSALAPDALRPQGQAGLQRPHRTTVAMAGTGRRLPLQ